MGTLCDLAVKLKKNKSKPHQLLERTRAQCTYCSRCVTLRESLQHERWNILIPGECKIAQTNLATPSGSNIFSLHV